MKKRLIISLFICLFILMIIIISVLGTSEGTNINQTKKPDIIIKNVQLVGTDSGVKDEGIQFTTYRYKGIIKNIGEGDVTNTFYICGRSADINYCASSATIMQQYFRKIVGGEIAQPESWLSRIFRSIKTIFKIKTPSGVEIQSEIGVDSLEPGESIEFTMDSINRKLDTFEADTYKYYPDGSTNRKICLEKSETVPEATSPILLKFKEYTLPEGSELTLPNGVEYTVEEGNLKNKQTEEIYSEKTFPVKTKLVISGVEYTLKEGDSVMIPLEATSPQKIYKIQVPPSQEITPSTECSIETMNNLIDESREDNNIYII